MRFEVESKYETNGRGYVVARILDKQDFSLCGEHSLGGAAVEPWLDQPRALDASGNQRTDLFAFALKRVEDLERIEVGTTVELSKG